MTFFFLPERQTAIVESSQELLPFDLVGSRVVVENEEKSTIWTFDLDGSHIIVNDTEGEKVATLALKQLSGKKILPSLSKSYNDLTPIRSPSLIQSNIAPLLSTPPPGNPYENAFHTKLSLGENNWHKSFYFLHSKNLSARNSMAKISELHLPSGKKVFLTKQMLVDVYRWEENSLLLNDITVKLPRAKTGVSGEVNIELLTLIDRVYRLLNQNSTLLERFSSYFHQGPYNDIFYTIQSAVQKQFKVCLHQDQRLMRRRAHLLTSHKNNAKLILSITGLFRYAFKDGIDLIEAAADGCFGHFYGIVVINLNTQIAFSRLGAELDDTIFTAL